MFHIVFYTPEIPPNTGNAMRLAAVTGCRLHLIEPLGFEMDNTRLRRAGMDYRDKAVTTVHGSLDAWRSTTDPGRTFALTVDGDRLYTEEAFRAGDTFLFGPESVGLPEEVTAAPWVTATLRLPMVAGVRSINLGNAASIVIYEAWRQIGFSGAAD